MGQILVVEDDGLLRRHISKLLEGADHEVRTAENGQDGLTKLRGYNPDLILVDFVMPKMNGFQFCAALRTMADHRDTPIVLLSGRSDRIRDSFIERFNVRDAISKPFQDEALLAVVQNVLGDSQVKKWSIPAPLSNLLKELSTNEKPPSKDPISAASELITGFITNAVADLKGRKKEITKAIAAGLKSGSPSGCAELMVELENVSDSLAFSGNASTFPLPDVMQLLAMQRQEGVMEVSQDGSQATLQFRLGYVELAVGKSIRQEFLLGRYLVEEELISQQDLNLLIKSSSGPHLLGEQLVKLGYITEADLIKVLRRQTSEIVYEILRWNEARFRFHPGKEIPGSAQTGNQLDVGNLVMEGLRQVDEWRLMERDIPDFDTLLEAVDAKGAMFDPKELSVDEAQVFDCVPHKPTTVRDIIAAANMSSFNVCKILYRLISVKLIRRIKPNQ